MIVGFTGTRRGLTTLQRRTLQRVAETTVREDGVILFVHGGCHGADSSADDVFARLAVPRRVRPGPDSSEYTWHKGAEVMERRPNLDRNRDIVADADVLIACPSNYVNIPRGSGTWATVRYARVKGIPIRFIWNDGSQTEELP